VKCDCSAAADDKHRQHVASCAFVATIVTERSNNMMAVAERVAGALDESMPASGAYVIVLFDSQTGAIARAQSLDEAGSLMLLRLVLRTADAPAKANTADVRCDSCGKPGREDVHAMPRRLGVPGVRVASC
jgi:hypothetical protein